MRCNIGVEVPVNDPILPRGVAVSRSGGQSSPIDLARPLSWAVDSTSLIPYSCKIVLIECVIINIYGKSL